MALQLAAAALVFLLVSTTTTPIAQSAPTRDEVKAECKKAQDQFKCLEYLLDNLDAGTAAVNYVPAFSVQVVGKLAREALRFAANYTKHHDGKQQPLSNCFQNCVNDVETVSKKIEGLPAEIKPGDEAPIVSFYQGFKKTCGNDCSRDDESDEEYDMERKFMDVYDALNVVKDLFFMEQDQKKGSVQPPSA